MAAPNIEELVTHTLRNRSRALADNVSENNALLKRLKERGRIKTISGGRTIAQELMYAENSTYKRYSGYEILNISPSEIMTAAEFGIKQAAVAITMSGLEELQNSGPEQMIDLLESRIENAEMTMENNMSNDIYSDGTADSGKQITGLQALIADDPTTGTVGGINRATYSFWQNKIYDFSDESVTPGSDTIQTAMNTLYLRCSRNADHTDLIVADNTYFQYYWESLQAIQRITSMSGGGTAGAGFSSLKFMNADVMFDGGYNGSCPANHMYFLNSRYIHFRPHRDRNMVPLRPDRYATNQDAMVKLWAWAGNMTLSNAFVQGVIVA